MKNSIILIPILFLVSAVTCYAQDTDFKKPVVHAEKQSYNVTETNGHNKTIRNLNNHLFKIKTNYSSKYDNSPIIKPKANDIRVDKKVMAQIFYTIFSENRIKQLASENLNILVHFYSDLNGNVLELGFTLSDNSTITPIELEKLENQLKKEVKFTLNSKVFQGNDYVPLYYSVNFKMLLSHSTSAIYP